MRQQTPRHHVHRAAARGFTLAEALVSLGILSVLLIGMQSAILLAGKAMPDANPLSARVASGRRAQDALASDLTYATNIISKSAADITFEVADRDGDAKPEVIRFYWTGAGSPLIRVYNGVESVVAKDVQDFQLTYATRSVSKSETVTTEVEDSTDKVVGSFTAYPSTAGTVTTSGFEVAPSAGLLSEKKGWAAEYFKLSGVPSGASKVRFTKVEVWLKAYVGSLSDPTAAVFTAGGSSSAPTVGAQGGGAGTLSRAGLSTTGFNPVSATLPSGATSTGLAGGFYAVVKGHDLLTPSAYVRYYTPAKAVADTPHMEWTTNGGSTWQPGSANWNAQDMTFRVYGRYITSATVTTTTTTYYLTSVAMTLNASKESNARVDTAVQVLNEPQVSAP